MTLRIARITLWFALCGILCLSVAVYALRTENARLRAEVIVWRGDALARDNSLREATSQNTDLRLQNESLCIYADAMRKENARLKARIMEMEREKD